MYDIRTTALNSPCHACDLRDEDKNNDRCLKCDARAEYSFLVDEGLVPTVLSIEKQNIGHRISNIGKAEKEKVVMSQYKIGICSNCERSDMPLPGHGRCWLCYEAGRNAVQAGESVEDALAVVKERVKGKKDLKGRAWGKKGEKKDSRIQGSSEKRNQEPEKEEQNIGHRTSNIEEKQNIEPADIFSLQPKPLQPDYPWGLMYLEFKTERDVKILEWLNKEAEDHRRRPDQEIMWILQNYIEVETVQEPEV